jgi:RHS repeat-associated protein
LGSVRELTDGSGNVRARYAYDPYGRRTKLSGDVDVDFGFTGLFFASEAGLLVALYRAYDAELGRWLSRDPLRKAELQEGPNLYVYVRNNPVTGTDPLDCAANLKPIESTIHERCEVWRAVWAVLKGFRVGLHQLYSERVRTAPVSQGAGAAEALCVRVQEGHRPPQRYILGVQDRWPSTARSSFWDLSLGDTQ